MSEHLRAYESHIERVDLALAQEQWEQARAVLEELPFPWLRVLLASRCVAAEHGPLAALTYLAQHFEGLERNAHCWAWRGELQQHCVRF